MYCDCHEEDTRPREEVWMVEALPYRIPSAFCVRVKCHLNPTSLKLFDVPFLIEVAHLSVKPKLLRKLKVNLRISALRRVPRVSQLINVANVHPP